MKQESKTDCGIVCLLAIMKAYGCCVPRDYLVMQAGVLEQGISMYELANLATSFGFQAVGKQGTLEQLAKEDYPVIAHVVKQEGKIKLPHFIVICEKNDSQNFVKIMDPAQGIKKIDLSKLHLWLSGHFLFINPTANLKKITLKKTVFCQIKKVLQKHKILCIGLITCLLLHTILELLTFFETKIFLNVVIFPKVLLNVIPLLYCFFLLLVLKCSFHTVASFYQTKLSYQIRKTVTYHLFQQLMMLPYLYYQTSNKNRWLFLGEEITWLSNFYVSFLSTVVTKIPLLLFMYSYLGYLSKKFLVFVLFCNVILLLLCYIEQKTEQQKVEDYYCQKDKTSTLFRQLINLPETIKGLHLENNRLRKLKKQQHLLLSASYQLDFRKIKEETVFALMEGSIYLIILLLGAFLLVDSSQPLSLENFLLLESFSMTALKTGELLFAYVLQWQKYRQTCYRLDEIFYLKKERFLPHPELMMPKETKDIKVEQLSFAYESGLIISRITLKIKAGEKIFIYGNSGSGKSTFLKLLGGYLPIDYGAIKIGNIDITHYNLDYLRKVVTYITSDGLIELGTLKDNLTLGRRSSRTTDQLEQTCQLQELTNAFIEEEGKNISLGEKARLVLAQGLYQKSDIYLLDECLSHVDSALEEKIIQKLLKTYSQQTILYVSHRLTHKNLFDRILRFEKGRCYEELSKN